MSGEVAEKEASGVGTRVLAVESTEVERAGVVYSGEGRLGSTFIGLGWAMSPLNRRLAWYVRPRGWWNGIVGLGGPHSREHCDEASSRSSMLTTPERSGVNGEIKDEVRDEGAENVERAGTAGARGEVMAEKKVTCERTSQTVFA